MQFSEPAPQITPGTGLQTKATRTFFLLGCVIDTLKEWKSSNIWKQT